ncbi:MAG: hypothetical protein Q8Q89_03825 [bacterium]|nr:hypothetical protein [bacterium]
MKRMFLIAIFALVLFCVKEANAQSMNDSFKPAFDILVGGQSAQDSNKKPVYGVGVHASILGNLGLGFLAGATSLPKNDGSSDKHRNTGTFMLTVPFSLKLGDDGQVGYYLTFAYGRSLVVGDGKNFNTFLAGFSIGTR